jgi:hypothetical protein
MWNNVHAEEFKEGDTDKIMAAVRAYIVLRQLSQHSDQATGKKTEKLEFISQ